MTVRLTFLLASFSLPCLLKVASDRQYSTITILHEGSKYFLRPSVPGIRDCFETGEVAVLQENFGTHDIFDVLPKSNISSYSLLVRTLSTGLKEPCVLSGSTRATFTSA